MGGKFHLEQSEVYRAEAEDNEKTKNDESTPWQRLYNGMQWDREQFSDL
jgi:hypothetical protein